ncbi:unnamed protein product [Caenorhabditis sp. 36 PRJEB53466]|nr:unnamed protein product [Caenorhabditis sp. 36 PRJEB53466]
MPFDTYRPGIMNPAFEEYYNSYYLRHCNQNSSFFDDPNNYVRITSSIATAVFPIHILAFYCIIFKTPRAMEGIRKELLVLHVWLFYCDNALNVLLIGYLFVPTFCGVSLGVLNHYGVPVVVIGYLGQIGISGVATSLIILFETRYDAVAPDNILSKWAMGKQCFIAINYIYTSTFLLPSFFAWTPHERQIVEKMNALTVIPCPTPLFFDDQAVVGFPAESTWLAFFSCSIFATVVIVQIAFFVVKTVYISFFTINVSVSLRTRSMQSRLFRCLCIQVAIPTVVLVVPSIYLCFSIPTAHYDQTMNNVQVLMFSSHGTLSSLCTILIYNPYRQVLKSLLTCGTRAGRVSTVNVVKDSHIFNY